MKEQCQERDDSPTKEESSWWKRFSKIMDAMPPSMEILVGGYGGISAAIRGASKAEFERAGDVDNVPTILLPSIYPKGVENNGSSI